MESSPKLSPDAPVSVCPSLDLGWSCVARGVEHASALKWNTQSSYEHSLVTIVTYEHSLVTIV